jgi:hypothetical protein
MRATYPAHFPLLELCRKGSYSTPLIFHDLIYDGLS